MSIITSCYTKDHVFCRKIKCPRHYVLKNGGVPFVMERIPALINLKESDAKRLGITLWRKKKNPFGGYYQNFKDYDQPYVAASYCKETIYNLHHPICQKCGRRCFVK